MDRSSSRVSCLLDLSSLRPARALRCRTSDGWIGGLVALLGGEGRQGQRRRRGGGERESKEGRKGLFGRGKEGRSERAREVSGGASVDKREQIYAPARSVGCVDGGQGRPSGQVRPLRKRVVRGRVPSRILTEPEAILVGSCHPTITTAGRKWRLLLPFFSHGFLSFFHSRAGTHTVYTHRERGRSWCYPVPSSTGSSAWIPLYSRKFMKI